MKLTIYGGSDDLVEVEGAITEEFNYSGDEDEDTGVVLAFSDGTLLRVHYNADGIWRITPLSNGSAKYTKVFEATDSDGDAYSDRVELEGAFAWVVCGVAFAKAE